MWDTGLLLPVLNERYFSRGLLFRRGLLSFLLALSPLFLCTSGTDEPLPLPSMVFEEPVISLDEEARGVGGDVVRERRARIADDVDTGGD